VQYPGAIKAFAKEVCRNDLLNFGRLHFFFPDSRLALDLNTDKTLKVRARAAPAGAKPAPPGRTGAQAAWAPRRRLQSSTCPEARQLTDRAGEGRRMPDWRCHL